MSSDQQQSQSGLRQVSDERGGSQPAREVARDRRAIDYDRGEEHLVDEDYVELCSTDQLDRTAIYDAGTADRDGLRLCHRCKHVAANLGVDIDAE
jgi:hypothetical protein